MSLAEGVFKLTPESLFSLCKNSDFFDAQEWSHRLGNSGGALLDGTEQFYAFWDWIALRCRKLLFGCSRSFLSFGKTFINLRKWMIWDLYGGYLKQWEETMCFGLVSAHF